MAETIEEYVKMLQDKIENMHQNYKARREEIDERKREQSNKKREERTFEDGDVVAVLEKKITEGTGGSVKAKYTPRY